MKFGMTNMTTANLITNQRVKKSKFYLENLIIHHFIQQLTRTLQKVLGYVRTKNRRVDTHQDILNFSQKLKKKVGCSITWSSNIESKFFTKLG